MFSPEQLKIIEYCAQECSRQRSGEESVSWMLNAWNYAMLIPKTWPYDADFNPTGQEINGIQKINLDFIRELGKLIEPEINKEGFRNYPIGVSSGRGFDWKPIGSDWLNIKENLNLLLEAYYEGRLIFEEEGDIGRYGTIQSLSKSAEDEFYYHYERIHPFGDGNGRTGKILYNYLKGTLHDPVMPPNFFGIGNP